MRSGEDPGANPPKFSKVNNNPPVSVEERIRRYLATMPAAVSGSGGHDATFNAARALLHGFGLDPATARSFLDEYNARCDPPWTDAELEHKLKSVDGLQSRFPRGYLLNDRDTLPPRAERVKKGYTTESETKKKVEFDPDRLRKVAAPWRDVVDLVWLANRSAVDPATVSAEEFLRLLYRPEERVLVFTSEYSQGDAVWPAEEVPRGGRHGVWFLPQPVDGEWKANPGGKAKKEGEVPTSRRTWRSVTAFRYFVLESDEANVRDWLGFIVQAPLRIEALYTSGGRSVHALIRVDCRTKEEWDEQKRRLAPFLFGSLMLGADRGTWSAVRLSRLPGCLRRGKRTKDGGTETYRVARLQKLLYLRPNATLRPLVDLTPERDVEKAWLEVASYGIADSDDTGGRDLLAALRYYEPVSAALKAERVRLEEGLRNG